MRRNYQYQRPPNTYNPQWKHHGPRAPFHGKPHQFDQRRQYLQSENNNYWCETCDRSFPTEDILSQHKQQHQKCNIDGCQFIAHPKVITKHIQMQHSTGLYKKIANLKNPEEIEKWREERRKKYPTKSNIDKKAAELKAKIDRGEKMGLERKRNHNNVQYGSTQNRNYSSGPSEKRKKNMQNENQSRSKLSRKNTTNDTNYNKRPPQKAKPKTLPIVEEDRKLKPFAGILNLQMESDDELGHEDNNGTEINNLIDDDDYCEELKSIDTKFVNTNDPVVCGALSSLICEYGSSDEEDTKEKFNINVRKELPESLKDSKISQTYPILQKPNHIIKNTTHNGNNYLEGNIFKESNDAKMKNRAKDIVLTCHTKDLAKYENEVQKEKIESIESVKDHDSEPEEIKAVVIKEETLSGSVESFKARDVVLRKRTVKEKKLIFQRQKPKLPSTLLQKLLFKEMLQERNIVLQCIRYIRKNDYFDKKIITYVDV